MSSADVLRVVHDGESTMRPVTREPLDTALRPTSFDDFVGQTEVITNMRESVRAARSGGWQLDHFLMAGPAGLGKTSLATVIASELGAKLLATSASAIEHKGALATLLTALEDGEVLFIDELHALDHGVAECMYSAMEDHFVDLPSSRCVIRVPLPRFTLLGATTHAGRLPKPLLDRFGFVWQLRPYTLAEMETIIARSAMRLGITIDGDGAMALARASRGTPRIANRLLRRARDAAVNAVTGRAAAQRCDLGRTGIAISGPLATAALTRLGIDALGLTPLDRRYLTIVAARTVGIEAICAELAEHRSTIEDGVEPFLMQAGLVTRSGRGRFATATGIAHVHSIE